VATGDGKSRSLPAGISETTLRAAITRNGGDKLGADWPSPQGGLFYQLLPYMEQKQLYGPGEPGDPRRFVAPADKPAKP
jgi:hypothetical protein